MSNIIIYNTQDGKTSVSLLAKDGMVWMSQMQIAELFATTKQNISLHIQNILEEKELEQNSVVKEYLTTANDGKNYSVTHYSLEMILAIGFRVRSKRGTQFRQWANKNLKEYMIKGFVIDDERLIPRKFVTVVQTDKIEKAEIKKAIKNGIEVQGVRLESSKSLLIK